MGGYAFGCIISNYAVSIGKGIYGSVEINFSQGPVSYDVVIYRDRFSHQIYPLVNSFFVDTEMPKFLNVVHRQLTN